MDKVSMIDVIGNLKKWTSWDYKQYPLSQDEATTIIEYYEQTKTGEVQDGMDQD